MPRVGEFDHLTGTMWSGSHWVPRNSRLLGGLQQAQIGMGTMPAGGAPHPASQYHDYQRLMRNHYAQQASAATDFDADLPDAANPVLLLLGT